MKKRSWQTAPNLKRIFGQIRRKKRWTAWTQLFSAKPKSGAKVLFATSLGGYNHGMVFDSLAASGVWARGGEPEFLICDKMLPACSKIKFVENIEMTLEKPLSPKSCEGCVRSSSSILDHSPFHVWKYSTLISETERAELGRIASALTLDELKTYAIDGISIGEHAAAGALRFFARGDFAGEPNADVVLRKYFLSALYTKRVFENLLRKQKFDAVVAHHGIYVPQGVINEVCKKHGVRFVSWNPAYKKSCFILSHDDTYHKTMQLEPESQWLQGDFNKGRMATIDDYIYSRRSGTQDWIKFHEEGVQEASEIYSQLSLKKDLPVVTLLSNVVWDAQLHYQSNAFSGMVSWVLHTIEAFKNRPDLQLVIRVHPAELTGFVKSRQFLKDEILAKFPSLPENIRIVGPDEHISTYALCDLSNVVLIYNTKTGMEVTSTGSQVVVAGEAWIRNKGFSHDISSVEEYDAVLSSLPFAQKLSPELRKKAQIYAYHVFFRRMIPVELIEGVSRAEIKVVARSLGEILPGKDRGLDVICDGIMTGKPFVLDV